MVEALKQFPVPVQIVLIVCATIISGIFIWKMWEFYKKLID